MPNRLALTPTVSLRRIAVSAMDNNVYLLTSRQSGRQILIDAADDATAIVNLLAAGGTDVLPDGGGLLVGCLGQERPRPDLKMIITTHAHWDHVRALDELAHLTGAKLLAGGPDVAAVEARGRVCGVHPLRHGQIVDLDEIHLKVIALHGHTPGSIALAWEPPDQPVHLFTGDSLFPGGVGNTDHDPVRFASLLDDVTNRLFAVYPDNTIVHPGHGQPTTLGAERPHLPEWSQRGW